MLWLSIARCGGYTFAILNQLILLCNNKLKMRNYFLKSNGDDGAEKQFLGLWEVQQQANI